MLRKILASIVSAIWTALSFVGRVATSPLRFLGGLAGGGAAGVPPMPEADDEIDAAPTPPQIDDTEVYARIAAAVMRWCTESVIADRQLPLSSPPAMPRSCSHWLRGLTRDELIKIGMASKTAVASHVRGTELIPGVRAVQSLPQKDWPPAVTQAAWDRGPRSIVSADYCADAEPVGAAVAVR